VTYADVVRAQFRKHRGSVAALWVFALLFLVATYAPLLAHDHPIWTDLQDAPASPWLRSLFDPRAFPQEVDVFFNLLMFTLPPVALVAWCARGRARNRALAALLLLQVVGTAVLSAARSDWRTEHVDYARRVREAHARALWPLLPHHPASARSEFSLTPPMREGVPRQGAPADPAEGRPFYVLGSDGLGNDVFTRLVYGTRISLTIGVIAVAIYVTIGVVLGALAGYAGGAVDDFLMFVAQTFMTIPQLFLILFLMSVIERPTIYHTMVVIGALNWPQVMRLVRGEFLRQREIDYVNAARALGLSPSRIMFRHIVPNALAPVFVSATFGVAAAILLESTLSFLGLGDPSAPSWGQILNNGFENGRNGRHLVWTAGGAIFATVLVLNLIGEGLRDALDPKLRR
jgi:peptide/nickel transport system permease protein